MNTYEKKCDDDTLEKLAHFDQKGFIYPPNTDPADYIQTARKTIEWADTIKEQLADSGFAEIVDEQFSDQQEVTAEILNLCLQPARERYKINPGWVPAFFSRRLLPWYVGGACFYFQEKGQNQVCFVLSDHLREQEKWLIYTRQEIVSHEICHVARTMMEQDIFEEPIAYNISESGFRRRTGPVFRGNWEAPALLGSSLFMMLGSIAGTFSGQYWIQHLTSAPVLVTVSALGIRALKAHKTLHSAMNNLEDYYEENAEAVVFRCTDKEIYELASKKSTEKVLERYKTDPANSIRWTLINQLFSL